MKERDIVDFQKMKEVDGEHYDENGNVVGCHICYTHEKAYEVFNDVNTERIPTPLCPVCNTPLVRRWASVTENGNAVVSEGNFSEPNGEIGLYSVWECGKCTNEYYNTQLYALMPIPVVWNANHDIYYTGGRTYLEEKNQKELSEKIFEAIKPSIEQYVNRKLNPENQMDKSLDMSDIMLWCSRDVEEVLANWFYENGYKK